MDIGIDVARITTDRLDVLVNLFDDDAQLHEILLARAHLALESVHLPTQVVVELLALGDGVRVDNHDQQHHRAESTEHDVDERHSERIQGAASLHCDARKLS